MNTNVAASIQQRLLNLAHSTGQDFQRILDQFVLERVLYRLSQSEHRALFVLKGAALYYLSGTRSPRPTRDLDLMAQSEAFSITATGLPPGAWRCVLCWSA